MIMSFTASEWKDDLTNYLTLALVQLLHAHLFGNMNIYIYENFTSILHFVVWIKCTCSFNLALWCHRSNHFICRYHGRWCLGSRLAGCQILHLQPLLWRHNGRDGVSNHQPRECILNRSSRRRSKKTSSSASLAFVRRIHRRPVNSPHKWPVTQKMFPFDDAIMHSWEDMANWAHSTEYNYVPRP